MKNFKKYTLTFVLGLTGLSAMTALLVYIINFHQQSLSNDSSNWSDFGGYVGGVVGTIFSFASVILIYLTFQRQQRTSILQQFESTFFNLMNIQREMMKSVKGKDLTGKPVDGQDFFECLVDMLESDFTLPPILNEKMELRNFICSKYDTRFDIAGATLGPYYRHLYHFIKYTNSSEIYNQKQKYMDLIQAQMSDAELYCLLYNAICYGNKKFQEMLDNYSFLENIERKSSTFDSYKRMFFPNTDFKYDVKVVPLGEVE